MQKNENKFYAWQIFIKFYVDASRKMFHIVFYFYLQISLLWLLANHQ